MDACLGNKELTTLLNLSEILKTPTRQLSLGQRMRCEIAASLLHKPDILFLDEPTIGLDAVSKLAVREFIKQMNERHKTTVILTTHVSLFTSMFGNLKENAFAFHQLANSVIILDEIQST